MVSYNPTKNISGVALTTLLMIIDVTSAALVVGSLPPQFQVKTPKTSSSSSPLSDEVAESQSMGRILIDSQGCSGQIRELTSVQVSGEMRFMNIISAATSRTIDADGS